MLLKVGERYDNRRSAMSLRWFISPGYIFTAVLSAIVGWHLEAHAETLRLKWTDTSNNETGFQIERMATNGDYVRIATVPANVQSYTDTGLSAGRTYCYRVRAVNASGASLPSNAGCTTAPSKSGSTAATDSSIPVAQNATENLNAVSNSRSSSKWSDYRVTMRIQSPAKDRLGFIFRYQDNDNYYRFSWADKSRRLEKRVAGAYKLLAQDSAAYKTGQTYALQIVAQGSALKVLIDGNSIFSVTDSSFSDGTIGLYSYQNIGGWFDDVVVEELPGGKVLLSDNFNDHDHVGWTIIDEASQRRPSNWSAATGALVQSSNISGTYALFTRGSWQDYRIALRMRSADNDSIGLMFRLQDRDNYYRFSWDRENAGRRLVKRERGAEKVMAQDSVPYVAGKNYNVEIVAQGSTLKVNVDGKAVLSVSDKSFKNGTIGLHSYANKGSVFDDVLVEELPTKAVLLWDDFNNGNFTGWTALNDSNLSEAPSGWSVMSKELVQRNDSATFLLY
jgi:Domain of Unknown Function (DUF1080)